MVAGNFAVAGYTISSINGDTSQASDDANDEIFYLILTEGAGTCSSSDASGCDSDATPNVTYTAGSLTDHAGTSLASTGAVASTDGAAPIAKYAKYKDVTSVDGRVDRVDITFSEAIVSDGYDDVAHDADYTVATSGTITLLDESAVATSGDDLRLTALGTAGITGGAVDPYVAYTSSFANGSRGLNDAAHNAVATFTIQVTDNAAPFATAYSYKDTNTNGQIDSVDITFSETLVMDEYDDADWAVTVAGTVNLLDESAAATTSAAVLRLTAAGDASKTGKNAGADPTMTYTAAGGTANSIHDAAGNNTGDLTLADISDAAVPQIVSSTGSDSDNDGKTNTYVITFSENLTDGGAASVSDANFTARNATTTAAITITSVAVGATAGGGATKVTLNLDDADADNYTGVIDFSYNSAGGGEVIEDASTATNDFANQTNTALTDDVAPVLLSSRAANVGGTADVLNAATEFIEFKFSEPMTLPTVGNLELALLFANGATDVDATDSNNLDDGATGATISLVTTTVTEDTIRATYASVSANPLTPATDTVRVTDTGITSANGTAGNETPAAVTIASADISAPTFSSRVTADLDADGKIDAIKITMNESILDSTLTAGNFAMGSSYVIASINGDTSQAGDDADDDIFYLILTEVATTCSSSDATGCDTDAVPTVTYTQGTLTDASSNLVATTLAVASTDGAAPIPKYAKYKDVTAVDGAVDRIDVTFSEAIVSDGYTDADYSIVEAGTVSLDDDTAVATSGDDLQIAAAGDANITGGATNPTFTYTNNFVDTTRGLNDEAGNAVATITAMEVTDAAAPYYVSSQTLDNNNDGTVDFVKVVYTESVLDSSVNATDFEAGTTAVTDSLLTESFSSGTPGSGNATDSANDSTVYIGVASSGETLTAKKTDYTLHIIQDSAITDALANSYASFTEKTSTDGAKPIVATVTIEDAASGDGLIDKVTLTWSENVDTDDGNAPVFGDLPTTLLPDGSTADFSGATISDPAGAAATVVVTVITGQATANTAAGSTAISGDLSAKWKDAAVSPNAAHATGGTANEAVVDSAKPVLKTSTTADTDANGTVDQITIVYSETVAITDGGAGFVGMSFANSCAAATADYSSAGTTTSVVTVGSCTAGDTTITASPTYDADTGTILDIASGANEMADNETVTGTDGAGPAVLTVSVSDADADGDLDTAALTYSENLTNTAAAANGFDVTSASSHGTCNTESADPAVSTSLTLTFACTTKNTAVGDLNIVFTASDNVEDSAGNNSPTKTFTSASSPAIADGASPVPLSATISKSVRNGNLQNGAIISVTFSETLVLDSVANGDFEFSRYTGEALAGANWPDGATVAYATSSASVLTMTLSAVTTSGLWGVVAKVNLDDNNIVAITDAATNQADQNAVALTISGTVGPWVDAITETVTDTTATIAWITDINTITNKVKYGLTTAVGSTSTSGSPGESSTTHSVSLSGLTAATRYYYQACSTGESTNQSETCSDILDFTTSAAAGTPSVSSQSPSDGTTGVAVTVVPYVTFSEAMATSTITNSTVQLRKYDDDSLVSAIVTYSTSNNIATITPVSSLANNTQYYIWVSGAANGAGTVVTSYTTKANQDFTTVADTTTLAVTGVSTVANPAGTTGYATADGTYNNGWAWTFNVTASSTQTALAMKFADFVSGANSIAVATSSSAGIIRYCSAQATTYDCSSDAEDSSTWRVITAANTYGSNITLSSDSDSATTGRQVTVKVQMKVPVGSSAGSYSSTYGVRTTTP